MLKYHFKFAFRNLSRNKIYSTINIAGLAISLTAFILMALYIEDELSFDRFNKKSADIYRVEDDKQTPSLLVRSASSAAPVAPALQKDFPEIKQAARVLHTESLIRYKEKLFEERSVFFADDNLFKIFDFNMVKGNSGNALTEPASVVLTTTSAQKYFNQDNPIGQVMTVDGQPMKVTGVLADIPATSHLQFDFLISMATAKQSGSGYDWLFTNWYSNEFYTYILLPQNFPAAQLSAQLAAFDNRHKSKDQTVHHYALEKLTAIYLHSNRDNQAGKTGNLTNLYVFSVIAVFILLIAAINFVNLSTARATARAKEVAVKKVAGAARPQLMAQFITESFITTALALLAALVIVMVSLPFFNAFSGKFITLNLFSPLHLGVLLLLLAGIGFLSGSYPAFILSGFMPATALKSKVNSSTFSIGLRKGLVVFQFAASVVLIVCSIVVYTQISFLQQHDLGFAASQTMVINFEGDKNVQQRLNSIKQQLREINGVQHITSSSNVPGDGRAGGWSMDIAKINGDTVHTEFPVYLTDYNYLAQYHIPVVAGRGFSDQYAADSIESVLINETAVKKLGFRSPEEALGVHVGMYPRDGKITGVFKDFHFESLQKPVEALAMRVLPGQFRILSVEISSANIRQTVAAIEVAWKKLAPERPLEYNFLDDSFNKQYQAEIKFGQVFTVFTVLAVLIACLGLFGLALFSVQQRTKEIGIRKVLGASVTDITTTLSKDFILLVGIAFLTGAPVAWYAMNKWLQHFAFRINIEWWIFVAAGGMALLIAIVTVSFQAIHAAIANPVKSLRTE